MRRWLIVLALLAAVAGCRTDPLPPATLPDAWPVMPWGDGSYPTNAVTSNAAWTTLPVAVTNLPVSAAWHATGNCAWCRTTKNLNVHHITPQSVAPELANVPANFIVLCRSCHFCVGHRGNWRTYNPDVAVICVTYTNAFKCGKPAEQP
jgi:hypothetical protein